MEKESGCYTSYVKVLRTELVPAMGCTEPIAVAYCAAKARQTLGTEPEEALIEASGNIIKNVKSVIVPNTNGLKGLESAAAAGIFLGDPDKELEVISSVSEEEKRRLPENMKKIKYTVEPLISDHVLDMKVTVKAGEHSAMVHICDEHTHIAEIVLDGVAVYEAGEEKKTVSAGMAADEDYAALDIADIFDFANTADLEDVRETLDRQISYNCAIADAGLVENYGARIGQLLMKQDNNVRTKARAYAAAGSDARMSGCELPVVINSGSGNQGMTASLPVIVYAREYGKTGEELYRALLVSNLVTIRLKTGIGRLSAYCGAVSAGAGAGAGIAYLLTRNLTVINHTIVNAIAITSGIVCDGAKPSCAAKIACAVDAGIMGFEMYEQGDEFKGGDGLVKKGVENTIDNISILGHDGMKETDKKIIEIMTGVS